MSGLFKRIYHPQRRRLCKCGGIARYGSEFCASCLYTADKRYGPTVRATYRPDEDTSRYPSADTGIRTAPPGSTERK